MPTLPFKLNADRHHHIPKQKRKVMNSGAYDAALGAVAICVGIA